MAAPWTDQTKYISSMWDLRFVADVCDSVEQQLLLYSPWRSHAMQKSHEFPQVVCIAGFNFSLGSPYLAKYEIIIEDGQRRRLPLDSVIVSVSHSHEALHSPSLECWTAIDRGKAIHFASTLVSSYCIRLSYGHSIQFIMLCCCGLFTLIEINETHTRHLLMQYREVLTRYCSGQPKHHEFGRIL